MCTKWVHFFSRGAPVTLRSHNSLHFIKECRPILPKMGTESASIVHSWIPLTSFSLSLHPRGIRVPAAPSPTGAVAKCVDAHHTMRREKTSPKQLTTFNQSPPAFNLFTIHREHTDCVACLSPPRNFKLSPARGRLSPAPGSWLPAAPRSCCENTPLPNPTLLLLNRGG